MGEKFRHNTSSQPGLTIRSKPGNPNSFNKVTGQNPSAVTAYSNIGPKRPKKENQISEEGAEPLTSTEILKNRPSDGKKKARSKPSTCQTNHEKKKRSLAMNRLS